MEAIEVIKQWKDGTLMTREEALEQLASFDEMAPEELEGVLKGGHTAKAVLMGLLRLVVRVDVLEEKVEVLTEAIT